jgi:hypothetical protein
MLAELNGFVTSVKTKDTDNHLQVFAPKSGKTYTVISPFFLPFEIGDKIYAVCQYENLEEPMFIERHPHVTIPRDEDAIVKFLGITFKSRRNDFYETVLSMTKCKSSVGVFKYLSKLACDFKRDNVVANQFPEFIDDSQYNKFLGSWYFHKVLRQFLLLGITDEEFKEYRSTGDFYEECIKNPYKIYTISLDKADHILSIFNRRPTDQERYCGNIVREIYAVVKKKGHVGIRIDEAKRRFDISNIMDVLTNDYDVVFDLNTMYLRYYYTVEVELAKNFKPGDSDFPLVTFSKSVSPDQERALNFCLNNKVSIITGSAGTGKTTIIKELVCILNRVQMSYKIVSFTGKAVARVKEVTGASAMTMHRSIAAGCPDFDILIIDEISMVSNDLMYMFFCMYPVKYKIIMIGDPNQLPPIDWGDMLGQLLKVIPNFKLTTQHRQESVDMTTMYDLVLNKDFLPREGTDNFAIVQGAEEKVYEIAETLKNQGILCEDIAVISPLNKDVKVLNRNLQTLFNDKTDSIEDTVMNREFHIGDKVMMTENEYTYDIFNGDEGEITKIHHDYRKITVLFGKKLGPSGAKIIDFFLDIRRAEKEKFKKMSTDVLTHSYCMTVHRSQGSEWQYVIFYISEFSNFISNNILYTGITRARKRVWLICDKLHSVNKAIINEMDVRLDNLALRIQGEK